MTLEILIQGLTWLFSAVAADVVVATIFCCIIVVQLKPDVATDLGNDSELYSC